MSKRNTEESTLQNSIDLRQVKLMPATRSDNPIIENLARIYAYDISQYFGHLPGWEMEDDGLYGVGIDYKRYWKAENSFPFLIRYKDELAGFAIIDKEVNDASCEFNMAQFFVLRTYKGKGIGKFIAYQCFDKFPGVWQVMVMPGNDGAYKFWSSVIKEYTKDNFREEIIPYKDNEKRILFIFSSSPLAINRSA